MQINLRWINHKENDERDIQKFAKNFTCHDERKISNFLKNLIYQQFVNINSWFI